MHNFVLQMQKMTRMKRSSKHKRRNGIKIVCTLLMPFINYLIETAVQKHSTKEQFKTFLDCKIERETETESDSYTEADN